jgi:4-aminobutyrate---pyruvate transaminase
VDSQQTPNTLAGRDIAYLVHPVTNLRLHEATGPLVIDHGKGVRIFDTNGRSYIDGMAGLWCAALGYDEPRLVEAAARQMRRLPYQSTFAHRSNEPTIALAEALIARAPIPMSKVIFQSSGSEAVDTAIKLVWYYHEAIGLPGKRKIIARERGYHGTSIASASLSGQEHMHHGFGLPLPGFLHTGSPHFYRDGRPGESEEAFATRRAEELEQLILREDPKTVGAFFAEPIIGAGGVILPPATYFEKIQAVLRRYDVLFVADEVICGFGRTGNYWGSQTYQLRPDLLTCAKALSAAYFPISAVLMTDRIYQSIAEQSAKLGVLAHGYTMGGHPVGAAVALETLRIYDEDRIVDHVREVAPVLQTGLRHLKAHPLVGDARGIGLIGALEFIEDREAKKPFDAALKVSTKVMDALRARGVLLRALGDSLVCSPPLIITAAEIETILSALSMALDEVYAALRPSLGR